jgi:hypothetical protein
MPPVPSIIIAAFLFSVRYLIGYLLGVPEKVFVFYPGFLLGYLWYGSLHYAIHAWNPPYKWLSLFGAIIICIIIKTNRRVLV